MGIYGLTSYITNHSDDLLVDYRLYNSPVLIDGNSAASLIYSNLTRSNHAFGGDYDKYAKSTTDFVNLLRKCDLQPVFVFDGGYELRKLKTVLDRIKMNIVVCGQYKNKYRESRSFPLLLRDDFRTTLISLSVPVIQCDFEADHELIVLARILGCPIISYDSDFYISDATYIPFTSIEFRAVRFKRKTTKHKYYIPCKKFNVDEFLTRAGGIPDKSLLPLLSCALGNDYIPANTFKNFLNLTYLVKFDDRIKKIVKWLNKVTNIEQAVDKMVETVEKQRSIIKGKVQQMLTEFNRNSSQLIDYLPAEIATKVSPYGSKHVLPSFDGIQNSDDDEHLLPKSFVNLTVNTTSADLEFSLNEEERILEIEDGIEVLNVEEYELIDSSDGDELEMASLIDTAEIPDTEKNLEYKSTSFNSTGNEEPQIFDEIRHPTNFSESFIDISETVERPKVPEWFLKKFRNGLIPPNVVNILNFQRLFITSQSEDYFSTPSHELCLPLMKMIIGIILGRRYEDTIVKCHARIKGMQLGVYEIVPTFESPSLRPLPSLKSVSDTDASSRAAILLDCLNIPINSKLELFPEEWRLYIITLMYWKKHCKHANVNGSHIRALIMCLIYLSVIDRKIGFARSASDLKKIRKEKLGVLRSEATNHEIPNNDLNEERNHDNESGTTQSLFTEQKKYATLEDYLNLMREDDCLKAADALFNYHQIDQNLLQNRKEFNVKLVHNFAQLQHCIQTVSLLNSVLNLPFQHCQPHAVFSGTFLYNFYSEMHKRKLGDGYITRTLLAKANTIISLYRYVITSWEALTSTKVVKPKLEIRKKSKKKKCHVPVILEKENPDVLAYNDPDNIFSMLTDE